MKVLSYSSMPVGQYTAHPIACLFVLALTVLLLRRAMLSTDSCAEKIVAGTTSYTVHPIARLSVLALIVLLGALPSFFSTEQRSLRIAVRSKSSPELYGDRLTATVVRFLLAHIVFPCWTPT